MIETGKRWENTIFYLSVKDVIVVLSHLLLSFTSFDKI